MKNILSVIKNTVKRIVKKVKSFFTKEEVETEETTVKTIEEELIEDEEFFNTLSEEDKQFLLRQKNETRKQKNLFVSFVCFINSETGKILSVLAMIFIWYKVQMKIMDQY